MKNLRGSLPRTGEGIVIDIGTGDGRFVSAMARANPNMFFIGIDANVKPLEKPSMKATRKPNKGGLSNVMFVQAAVEFLPEEFTGIADEIHIHFPWGSLLRAVALGDEKFLTDLRRIAALECLLEIVVGIDPGRDRTELNRLGLPEISRSYFEDKLVRLYMAAGFQLIELRNLTSKECRNIESSWSKRLTENPARKVTYFVLQAT